MIWTIIAAILLIALSGFILARIRLRPSDMIVMCGIGHPVQLRMHGHIGSLYIDLSTGDRWIKVGEQEDDWSIAPEDPDAT